MTRTLQALSVFEISLIRTNRGQETLGWLGPGLPAAVATALPALLEKQVLRLKRVGSDKIPSLYAWTPIGLEVAKAL